MNRYERQGVTEFGVPDIGDITQRLAYTKAAQEDFAQAEAIATALWHPDYYLAVAAARIEVGLDAEDLLEKVYKPGEDLDFQNSILMLGDISMLEAKRGNVKQAIDLLARAEQEHAVIKPSVPVYIEVAKAQAKVGKDPSEFFAKAMNVAGKRYHRFRRWFSFEAFEYSSVKVSDLMYVAKAQYEIGSDPQETLSQAIAVAAVDTENQEGSYKTLAIACAEMGFFDQALIFADTLPHDERKHSSVDRYAHVVRAIAPGLIRVGRFTDAIKIIDRTKRKDLIAENRAHVAIAKAEQQFHPTVQTEKPENDITIALTHATVVHEPLERIRLFALIGHAQIRHDQDPTGFQIAKNHLNRLENSYDKAIGYTDIAVHQARAEIDAQETFQQAMYVTEAMQEQEGFDSLDEIEQGMQYEEIADSAIDYGYFDLAREIIRKLPEKEKSGKLNLLLHLAKAEAERGISVSELATYERALLMHHADQDFKTAMSMVTSLDDSPQKVQAALDVTTEMVLAGLDPHVNPTDILGNIDANDYRNSNIVSAAKSLQVLMGDITSAPPSLELAQMMLQRGEDPRQIFDHLFATYHVSSTNVRWIGELAETARSMGYTVAKEHIDRFRQFGDTLELVKTYAHAGYPDEALEIWQQAEPVGYHHEAEALASIAVAQAQIGNDPRQTIEQTIKLTEALTEKKSEAYSPFWQQGQIYATLSQAAATYGLDTQPLVQRALEKAQQEQWDNLQTFAYIAIAKAQVNSGVDARSTLVIALQAADALVHPGEEGNDIYYDGTIQFMTWEDIFEVQLTAGYYDDARATLNRMDRYFPFNIFFQCNKATLLAKLARAELQKAREIDR